MKQNENIAMLEEVAKALDELREAIVFIGGATTALYIDDPASPSPTPSDDVDCVVELTSKQAYQELEAKLRKKGFHDPLTEEDSPICRKHLNGIKVDVMPTDASILGFSNRWYIEAIAHKERKLLPSGTAIYIFSAPYFIASKLTAYNDRGRSEDLRTSQDIEDICALLEGCTYLKKSISEASPHVANFICEEFTKLLDDESLFEEAAHGFIRRHGDPNGRARHIVSIAREVIGD